MLADKQVLTPGDVQLLTGGPPCQVRRLLVMLCVLRALPQLFHKGRAVTLPSAQAAWNEGASRLRCALLVRPCFSFAPHKIVSRESAY
jgi:hypothetical protein